MNPADALQRYDPVDLDTLDERASLQSRVDHKYVIDVDSLSDVLDHLRDGHDVLEIDGDRSFTYRSVYFDTPSLTCFEEHLDDKKPRYKLRTRSYVTTDKCVFEVKVKQEDGETVKWSSDHASEDELGEEAIGLIDEALGRSGVKLPPEVRATLVTEFTRSTIALKGGAERTTIDRDVRLTCPGRESLALRKNYALLETKTQDGHGRADQALAEAGAERVSFSKYRLGVGQLIAARDDSEYAAPLLGFFERQRTPKDDQAAHIFDDSRSAEVGVRLQPNPADVIGK